jgi:sulfur-carrier protein
MHRSLRQSQSAYPQSESQHLPPIPSGRYNLPVPPTVRVKVLFFGRLKEIVGQAEDSASLPEGAPIESLFARYTATHPELAQYRASLVASRNQEFAAWTTPLLSGDEVAFLPPVSGG